MGVRKLTFGFGDSLYRCYVILTEVIFTRIDIVKMSQDESGITTDLFRDTPVRYLGKWMNLWSNISFDYYTSPDSPIQN